MIEIAFPQAIAFFSYSIPAIAQAGLLPIAFFFLVSAAGLAYGTYTDLKERIVSNWVTYGMLAIGLVGYAAWAFIAQDFMIFAFSAASTAIAFAFSLLLYKLGAWAGGDVKLFAGLAALNPVNPAMLSRAGIIALPFFAPIELPVFPFTLFIFSLFAMLPYGAFLAVARLAKNRKEKKKFFKESGNAAVQAVALAFLAAGFGTVLVFFGLNALLALPLLFIAAFLPKKAKYALAAAMAAAAIWLDGISGLEQGLFLAGCFLTVYFLFKLYSLSKVLLRKPVPVEKLEEGMISAVTIVENGKKVEIAEEEGIIKLIKQFVANKSGKAMQLPKPKGRVIAASNNAAGFSIEEIAELKKLAASGKIPGKLLVKESAPFVPAVLIAYLALNIVGDVIWFWLF